MRLFEYVVMFDWWALEFRVEDCFEASVFGVADDREAVTGLGLRFGYGGAADLILKSLPSEDYPTLLWDLVFLSRLGASPDPISL